MSVEIRSPSAKSPPICPAPSPPAPVWPAHATTPPDKSALLDKRGKKRIQKMSGSFLFYCRAVDCTMLKGLNTISRKQSKPTQKTNERASHFMDYAATNPDTIVRDYASDMKLKIHSKSSYLNEEDAQSNFGGYYFLGWNQRDNEPIKLNGVVYVACSVLGPVAASVVEAELGGLFHNAQRGTIHRLTLTKMGWPQGSTDIFVDNSVAHGIANISGKRQRSR
ncbi:hypothetical protein ACHAWF_000584, partial [Thalassiosira exigua]